MDADPIYAECGFPTGEYADTVAWFEFYGDLARLPGEDNEEYRKFLRAAWALAGARVHSDRTGRASAIAAAQGTLAFLRAVQAIQRSPRVSDVGPPE